MLTNVRSAVIRACQKRKKYKNLPGPDGYSIAVKILRAAEGLKV